MNARLIFSEIAAHKLHAKRLWLFCGALVFAFAAPCRADASAPTSLPTSETFTIAIHGFMFTPSKVTVPVGATVTWQNLDEEPHTVASVDGKFRSGALDQHESFKFQFVTPGTYQYGCSFHPQMIGTVIVKP